MACVSWAAPLPPAVPGCPRTWAAPRVGLRVLGCHTPVIGRCAVSAWLRRAARCVGSSPGVTCIHHPAPPLPSGIPLQGNSSWLLRPPPDGRVFSEAILCMWARASAWTLACLSPGSTPRAGTSGPHGRGTFHFLRNCQTVFKSVCSVLYRRSPTYAGLTYNILSL